MLQYKTFHQSAETNSLMAHNMKKPVVPRLTSYQIHEIEQLITTSTQFPVRQEFLRQKGRLLTAFIKCSIPTIMHISHHE